VNVDLILANVVDAYRDNVALIQDPVRRQFEVTDSYYLEDRALLWGGPRKLVVTSLPVEPEHVRYLRETMGYACLENLSPHHPTDGLCDDVLRDDALRAAIVSRLRGEREVRLISFVASAGVLALAEALRREGLAVSTPECPPADLLWVRDYLDSKAGFRRFFAAIEPSLDGIRLPEGGIAQDCAEAARLAARFLAEGRACLCKPNNSQSGLGFHFLRPSEPPRDLAHCQQAIQARLEGDAQMTSDHVVVEELIDADCRVGGGSPSIEMRIPADPAQDVEFMYLCGQILTPEAHFSGVEMYGDLLSAALQRSLEAAGVAIAREVRHLGYVGVFDLDLVVGLDGAIYAVEINTRLTGGTHAHEAAQALFGPRYWERVAVICNSNVGFDGPRLTYAGLRQLLGALLFPSGDRPEGILPTIVSSLAENRLGYIVFGPSIERARELERALHQRLAASRRPLLARVPA
jgi:hypothetical protein